MVSLELSQSSNESTLQAYHQQVSQILMKPASALLIFGCRSVALSNVPPLELAPLLDAPTKSSERLSTALKVYHTNRGISKVN
jgi:hypothetical protein